VRQLDIKLIACNFAANVEATGRPWQTGSLGCRTFADNNEWGPVERVRLMRRTAIDQGVHGPAKVEETKTEHRSTDAPDRDRT